MFKEVFIVKTVEDQETFAAAGKPPSLKISVVFNYQNKADTDLRITFYGDRVKEAMVLKAGDKVDVGFTLKSSCSAKGFWGTYATGIFLKVVERLEDAPGEYVAHERQIAQGAKEVDESFQDMGLSGAIPFNEPDDLPF